MPKILLLDGNSLAYRAFFALPTDMATASGQVTNSVFGFTSMLINLLKEGQSMRKERELSLAQLSMAANAPMLTRAALVEGHLDAGILPTGQVAGLLDELPTVAELINRIMLEANEALERLTRTMPDRTPLA